MPPPKPNLRVEYRKQEHERVMASASLAEKFPTLKSLTVHLVYLTPGGGHQTGELKYTANIANARSVFRLDCSSQECLCGGHDLSQQLAEAVAQRRKTILGEATCQGWYNKQEINRARCLGILRYKFVLSYSGRC